MIFLVGDNDKSGWWIALSKCIFSFSEHRKNLADTVILKRENHGRRRPFYISTGRDTDRLLVLCCRSALPI